jgi:hypothetical protein
MRRRIRGPILAAFFAARVGILTFVEEYSVTANRKDTTTQRKKAVPIFLNGL